VAFAAFNLSDESSTAEVHLESIRFYPLIRFHPLLEPTTR